MASKINTVLTYRPIVPGSAKHLELIDRANGLGRLLYPALFERRDQERHRRASAAIAAAAARVTTKQEPPALAGTEGSPTSTDVGGLGGCSPECA